MRLVSLTFVGLPVMMVVLAILLFVLVLVRDGLGHGGVVDATHCAHNTRITLLPRWKL